MRSHAAKYTACIMLACVAAVLMAVPVFGQTVTVTVVGAGDIAREVASSRGHVKAIASERGCVTLEIECPNKVSLRRVVPHSLRNY